IADHVSIWRAEEWNLIGGGIQRHHLTGARDVLDAWHHRVTHLVADQAGATQSRHPEGAVELRISFLRGVDEDSAGANPKPRPLRLVRREWAGRCEHEHKRRRRQSREGTSDL